MGVNSSDDVLGTVCSLLKQSQKQMLSLTVRLLVTYLLNADILNVVAKTMEPMPTSTAPAPSMTYTHCTVHRLITYPSEGKKAVQVYVR